MSGSILFTAIGTAFFGTLAPLLLKSYLGFAVTLIAADGINNKVTTDIKERMSAT